MLAPVTGLARTYRTLARPARAGQREFAESLLQHLTDVDGVVDYDARDLDGYADGETVATWPAKRGGLTATATGAPLYRATDATMPTPAVEYDSTGNEYHSAPATLDWSTYTTATLLSVFYVPAGQGAQVRCPGCLRAGTSGTVSTVGGISHYAYEDKMTGLHRADGAAGFVYERDGDADTGVPIVCVTTHDTDAASPDEIRLWIDGAEETGAQFGSSGGLPWFSNLQALLGTRGGPSEGLNGRLARWIGTPRKLTADQALRASQALLYTART